MTQAEYEQIKAQVLEEQKAARRARAEERERINAAAGQMFDDTEREYLPKLVVKMSRRTGNCDCAIACKRQIDEAIRSVLTIIGERSCKTAYLNGRAEEANMVLRQLLDEILKL